MLFNKYLSVWPDIIQDLTQVEVSPAWAGQMVMRPAIRADVASQMVKRGIATRGSIIKVLE